MGMGNENWGESRGERCAGKRRCPGGGEGQKQVGLFDVEATQVRLSDLQTDYMTRSTIQDISIKPVSIHAEF